MFLSWWRRQLRQLFSAPRVTAPLRRRQRALHFDHLEDSTLLSVVPSVTGGTVLFPGTAQDSLYLQTDASGHLLYHDGTGTTFQSVLSGGKPFSWLDANRVYVISAIAIAGMVLAVLLKLDRDLIL